MTHPLPSITPFIIANAIRTFLFPTCAPCAQTPLRSPHIQEQLRCRMASTPNNWGSCDPKTSSNCQLAQQLVPHGTTFKRFFFFGPFAGAEVAFAMLRSSRMCCGPGDCRGLAMFFFPFQGVLHRQKLCGCPPISLGVVLGNLGMCWCVVTFRKLTDWRKLAERSRQDGFVIPGPWSLGKLKAQSNQLQLAELALFLSQNLMALTEPIGRWLWPIWIQFGHPV